MSVLADALRYEWVRIRTVRSTWVLTILSLLFTGLIAGLTAGGANAQTNVQGLAEALTAGSALTPLLMGLIGVFAFGHEYRFGVIYSTLTAVPLRSAVAAAKALMVMAWAAVVAVVCVLLSWVLAVTIGGGDYDRLSVTSAPVPRMLVGVVIWVVLWALFGLAYGGLFRNVPAAVTLLLVIPLVVENVIRALLSLDALEPIRDVGDYLPFTAGAQLYAYDPSAAQQDVPDAFTTTMSALTGGLTMALWAAALIALMWVLFERRDA
jgi:ABC-2 type transport system permease protein